VSACLAMTPSMKTCLFDLEVSRSVGRERRDSLFREPLRFNPQIFNSGPGSRDNVVVVVVVGGGKCSGRGGRLL